MKNGGTIKQENNVANNSTSDKIKAKLKQDGKRFWAGDNISAYLEEGDKQKLVDELTPKFEAVLDGLVIDIENDPNSMDTGRRLAKMYINELMAGRYDPMPNATAFPNDGDDRYEGMLVVRSELTSMCSHHHQIVKGVAYIGILAAETLIGLSKYNGKRIVIIDDINDTGRTLQGIHDVVCSEGLNEWVTYVSLLEKMSSNFSTQICAKELDEEEGKQWIVFPYEEWWNNKTGEQRG